jgi:iron complex transport system substrate-binding protein
MRIVSLLPSATELICEVGLEDSLVGVTHECDWPPLALELPKVTRTLIPTEASSREIDGLVRERLATGRALYVLDGPVLESLRPDLIVTQALCDVCAVAEEEVRAAACHLPGRPRVINLEPSTLREVLDSIDEVARAAECAAAGERARIALERRIEAVTGRTSRIRPRPRTVVLEWIDPPFSAGHWVPEIVDLAGGLEALGRPAQKSRTLAWEEVVAARPEVLFISCCGYSVARTLEDLPILERMPGYEDLPCVRSGRVYVLDGAAYLSRPGPRLVDALEIMAHALHPVLHPLPDGLAAATRVPGA